MDIIENTVYDHELSVPAPINRKCFLNRLLGKIPARFVLYLLSLSGFIVSFIIRNDINLTILAMVKDPKRSNMENSTEKYCYNFDNQVNETGLGLNYGGTLDWSSDAQSYVLAAFYWMYVCAHMIGGAVTKKFGTKRVFGFAQLTTALCSFCIPWAAEIHYGFVMTLRSVQGFASGFTWPAMYTIVAPWIPKQERSRFISSFQGSNLGTGIAYSLCGFIIANFGWRYVFYTTGSIGVVWCVIWYFLAFDSPDAHPRISYDEKDYIKNNTNASALNSRQQKVPWLSILRSVPVWAIAITCFGRVWVLYTFVIYGPQYMKGILGLSVEKNGFLSGAPFVFCYVSSVFFCYIADKIIIHGLLSTTNTRKLFTCFGQIIPAVLCVLLGYVGCNTTIILVLWFFAVVLLTAPFAGVMSNIVDIAPNFGGVVLGFTQTIYMIAGVFSPLVAGYLMRNGHTLSASRNIFNITAGIATVAYLAYHIWGTAEIQSWNYSGDTTNLKENQVMLKKIDTNNKEKTDN